jgi:hypothetical protein
MSVPGLSAIASLSGGVATPSASGVPSGCSYVAASQSFVCPAVTASGLTVTSSYFLLDAAGHPMSQFNASTVASLRVRNTIAGSVTVGGDSFTMDGQQDQTLSGLQTTTHTLNGTSTLNMSVAGGSETFPGPFTIQSTTTISNVVLPAHGSATSYPKSGTITVTSLLGGTALTSRFVMTFNGTSKVAVTMTVDGHSFPACSIDLSNGTNSCA